ncbi:MAG: bifunctional phosphopantothenoylcysteine decarboxylase/phosphopantothenate--cysteine ligase CoaBC [Candidatus Delongbacteria bacterium]|jgi:phosphopantothenoylcysteine decarboxylase/phosphopantothenate--cysteine ligase|nr:bifunctional phosphopantothenoylcysteine decarboxylase/phosphopantothenate--cysteine ligase CoaBC [Candidatus Delongbacteria bacterium]
MSLRHKKILLGITGSISAYKAAYLCRLFVKDGAEVQVVMTEMAKEFISPLTLSTLSGHPVLEQTHDSRSGAWTNHVALGLWADAFVVAPASLNTMGKMAHGIADNLLTTIYYAAKCPVFIAPAMDVDMFEHQTNKDNVAILQKNNCHFIEPGTGELASGLTGKGRLAAPEDIVKALQTYFKKKLKLKGKTFIVTAGPTYEKIDPVRYVGNFSSGKMGFAIAEHLAENGAQIMLITGPTAQETQHENIKRIDITSAEEMYNACINHFPDSDGAVMAAAVADYAPAASEEIKLKRHSDAIKLELSPTKDIAAKLGEIKTGNQMLVGFALETHDEIANAKKKLKQKNLDFIVLNSLNDKGSGFNVDTNKISIVKKSGKIDTFKLKNKHDVAKDIVNTMIEFIKAS